MNTLEIYCKLLSLSCKSKVNFDVLAKDQLYGYNIPKPFGLCVNTSNSNHKGTHWVSLFSNVNSNKIQFFDPYGMTSNYYGKEFFDFVSAQKGIMESSSLQLQSFVSDCCGEFNIVFLHLKSNVIQLKDIPSYFSTNLEENDKHVKQFVKSIKGGCIDLPESLGICVQICNSYDRTR